MKTNLLNGAFLLTALVAATAHANEGSNSHGGDIECDARIQVIASDIASWIAHGGPEVGQLDLSSSRNPLTSRPFSGAEKICKNTLSAAGITLVCDRELFMGISEELQYRQIHHEFATDVPGLEPDYGPLSTYKISEQLAAHLEVQQIKKLIVSPPQSSLATAFVPIWPGRYVKGSPPNEPGKRASCQASRFGGTEFCDETEHLSTIPTAFELQAAPVTQEQWVNVMGFNPASRKTLDQCPATFREVNHVPMCSTHPVETVTLLDVNAFLQKMNSRGDNYAYRLPTDDEYEYATRAGTKTAYFFGDDPNLFGHYAWFDMDEKRNFRTHPVAQKLPNAWGLYDMLGNVAEWTSTSFSNSNPLFGKSTYFKTRGLFWGYPTSGDYLTPLNQRSAAFWTTEVNSFADFLGFRLVRTHLEMPSHR